MTFGTPEQSLKSWSDFCLFFVFFLILMFLFVHSFVSFTVLNCYVRKKKTAVVTFLTMRAVYVKEKNSRQEFHLFFHLMNSL